MRTAIHTPTHQPHIPDSPRDTAQWNRLSRPALRQWTPLAAVAAVAAVLTVACADAATSTQSASLDPSASASVAVATATPSNYTIIDLGTLGGSFSIAFDINNAGRVSGAATLPGENQHAFAWERGHMTDLGTLGGPNSQGAGGEPGRAIAVLSETAQTDPLHENFCGFGTDQVCAAAVWRRGTLTALPTLGGVNAAALTYNVGGQIVGVADDGTPDASCLPPQKSHFQAATWTPEGVIHELPPLPGDEVGIALRGNDNGQVAGTSGLCSNTQFGGFAYGQHAVLWNNGRPTDLGNLGGSDGAVAAGVNNRGQVIGAASTSDGSLHPFLWTSATGMRDIGLMSADPADAANTPFQINDRGQMVGASCDATFSMCRGYIWQNGVMTDINDLLPADSPLYVIQPLTINESGQIAGLAVVKSTGEAHAFLATPAPGKVKESGPHATHRRMALPENVRKHLGRKVGRLGR